MADTPIAPLEDDCFVHSGGMITAGEALARLEASVRPVAGTEFVDLAIAGGRILAEPVIAARDIPDFDNAAVDGFGFAHSSLNATGETSLDIVGRSAAGHPFSGAVEQGQAIEILTGAPVPAGCDTIVMWEDVSQTEAKVTIPTGVKPSANRRRAGEDIRQGTAILKAGQRLRPQDIGLVASTGRPNLKVYIPLKIAVFSTGDELVQPGNALPQGWVYDSNRPILKSLIATTGAEMIDLGVLPDDRAAVGAALADAGQKYDLVITSGGASKGLEDHAVSVVEELGRLDVWMLAIKPGRPLALGRLGKATFVGLPGNPVAAMVCFLLFARPMITAMAGEGWTTPQRYNLPARFEMKKKSGRREYLRGIIESSDEGIVTGVAKFSRDGSGLLTSLSEAQGFIEIPEDVTQVKEGDLVSFLPFTSFGIL